MGAFHRKAKVRRPLHVQSEVYLPLTGAPEKMAVSLLGEKGPGGDAARLSWEDCDDVLSPRGKSPSIRMEKAIQEDNSPSLRKATKVV